MTTLSKFMATTAGFKLNTANCYELMHTWNPSCRGATWQITLSAFMYSLKIYTTFYLISTLARKWNKLSEVNVKRLLRDIAQSTLFLTTNAFFYLGTVCASRHAFGFFVWPMTGVLNSLVSCFIAILVERKNRRPTLALYFTNLASEVGFRMAQNRGWIKSIPKGQVILFAMAMSGFCYLKKRGSLDESLSGLLDLAYGSKSQKGALGDPLPSHLPRFLRSQILSLRKWAKPGPCCPHQHSCISQVVEKFIHRFGAAFAINFMVNLVTSLPAGILRHPQTLLTKRLLKIPLFLGLLASLKSATECSIRSSLHRDGPGVAAVGGFVSGLSMLAFPNVTIATYSFWKLLEIVYFKGVDRNMLPYWSHSDILLYTLSTGFVLTAAVIEPQAIRPGYWKFLMGLVGGRFELINRSLLDDFGLDSSKNFVNVAIPPIRPTETTFNPAFLFPK